MKKETIVVYKKRKKIPFFLNPLLLFAFAILGDAIFQLYFHKQFFSPFSYSPVAVYDGWVIMLYIESFVAICFGFLMSYIMYGAIKTKKASNSKQKLFVKTDRLNLISLALFIIILASLIINQLLLGRANFINILLGKVSTYTIHEHIKKGFFGIEGVPIIIAYFIVILWYSYRSLNLNSSKWLKFGIILALFEFVSIAEAQGLLYFIFAYILQAKNNYKMLSKLLLSFAVLLIVFMVTRIIRNPSHHIEFNLHYFSVFVFGAYLGSPIVNTTYVFANHLKTDLAPFFTNIIPHKLINLKSNLQKQMPDETSPEGLVGFAFMAGGSVFLFYYSFIIGLLVSWFYILSQKFFEFEIFLPFLLVTVAFSMMYINFLNLDFFWLPLLFSFIIKWITVKSH